LATLRVSAINHGATGIAGDAPARRTLCPREMSAVPQVDRNYSEFAPCARLAIAMSQHGSNGLPCRFAITSGRHRVQHRNKISGQDAMADVQGEEAELLGTIWGPHVLHEGEQPTRRSCARTPPEPSLTRIDAYSYVLGVKGSQVQILSSRRHEGSPQVRTCGDPSFLIYSRGCP
jgi:hypothetical protein